MGSTVARRFALDHAERTLGLVLVSSFATYRGNPAATELAAAVAGLADPVDPVFVRDFQAGTVARPVPPAFFETMVAESLKPPARVWQAVLRDQMEADLSAEIGVIRAPALILWGDRDAYCRRRDQEALAAALKGSRLVTYAGTGHAPHWEEPERFAADVAAFAAGLAGADQVARRHVA